MKLNIYFYFQLKVLYLLTENNISEGLAVHLLAKSS